MIRTWPTRLIKVKRVQIMHLKGSLRLTKWHKTFHLKSMKHLCITLWLEWNTQLSCFADFFFAFLLEKQHNGKCHEERLPYFVFFTGCTVMSLCRCSHKLRHTPVSILSLMSLCCKCEPGLTLHGTTTWNLLPALCNLMAQCAQLLCSRNFILSALPADFAGTWWNTVKYNSLH